MSTARWISGVCRATQRHPTDVSGEAMSNIVIKSCPECTTIRTFTQEIVVALSNDFKLNAKIEDDVPGEFAVFVDRVPLIQCKGDDLSFAPLMGVGPMTKERPRWPSDPAA
jgi:hypothetical protein